MMIEHNMIGMNDDHHGMHHIHYNDHHGPHDRMPPLTPAGMTPFSSSNGLQPSHPSPPSPELSGGGPIMLQTNGGITRCNGGTNSDDHSPSNGMMPQTDSNGNHEPVSEPGICAGCGGKIVDRYFLMAVDKQWHLSCLTCVDCRLQLDSELTCFAKDGRIFCKEDYYRRFAVNKCARCESNIASNELVMKARNYVYHMHCFTCLSCNNILNTGEHFGMKDTMIYCKVHYEMILQQEDAMINTTPPPGSHHGHHNNLPFIGGTGTIQKGRPRKRKSPLPEVDMCMPMGMCGDNDLGLVSDMYSGGHNIPRQKRVRTSFKHHQLRTMKTYFNLNHNPDAKDLKQLAQKTGLSKRVLQVWFQNARAKYRRGVLKDPQGREIPPPEGCDDGSMDLGGMSDIGNTGSPAMSDISCSDNSLNDHLHNSNNNHQTSLSDNSEHSQSTGSTLTELFTNSINTIN